MVGALRIPKWRRVGGLRLFELHQEKGGKTVAVFVEQCAEEFSRGVRREEEEEG